jgi:predicted pyridoxine 5'-phosphate oxidase superfamily flavin-nucleotide-binding protein
VSAGASDGGRAATRPTSDLAFTAAVKAIQERKGSRGSYARLERRGGFESRITPELAAFLAERDSVHLATASAAGQPYVQHRGGPRGFLRALDERTLGFADFPGNRQYITLGNLAENDRAFLFALDYATQRRIKLWGRASAVEGDAALMERLVDPAYDATPEQAIVFRVEAWDENCRRHIPRLFGAGEVGAAIERLEARIAALEAENQALAAQLRARAGSPAPPVAG